MKLPTRIIIPWILLLAAAASGAGSLQNPGFELPPSNWRPNSTAPLDGNSTIPGWGFQGGVQYVTSGPDLSLPQNGHAVLLAQDGRINQTFTANSERMQYVLTFSLARGVQNRSCSSNASLVVSAPDSSAQFSFSGEYGKGDWEVYGHQIGSWGDGESVDLVIQSQAVDSDPNSTCWPVVDDLSLIAIGSSSISQDKGNLLQNGGFEVGPAFPESSRPRQGVLLDSEPSLAESALQHWTVMGTVKYINSESYYVPEGKAALEIVGISAGVQTVKQLTQGSDYSLQFMLGDANDSCTGDFVVGIAAGSAAQNFTVRSNGTGSTQKHTLAFRGDGSSPTSISFLSYTVRRRDDGVLCGPVIDGVVLSGSSVCKPNIVSAFVVLVVVMLVKIGNANCCFPDSFLVSKEKTGFVIVPEAT